jgi:2,4-dienoyl-CoA reductase (NADPH2)
MPGGNGIKEACAIARILEEEGVDAINVTGGFNESMVPQTNMILPKGTFTYLGAMVKKAVSIPVIAGTRVNTPPLAEAALQEGKADLVYIGRALLADPEFPQKAMEGRDADIRPCIGCNQGCFETSMKFRRATCLMNPQMAHENELKILPAQTRNRVMVVGGGPGGMEAAMVCAMRGHDVSLYEKAHRLGGQANLAYIPPGRADFRRVVAYLSRQIRQLKVDVRLNCEVDEKVISQANPDVVILATGARPIVPSIPGFDDPRVVSYWDVLEEKCTTGENVVVIGGGATGCETALFLAKIGTLNSEQLHFLACHQAENWDTLESCLWEGSKTITIVEQESKLGQNIGATSRPIILRELKKHGVRIMTNAKVVSLQPDGLKMDQSGKERIVEADTVIPAMGVRSENRLADRIRDTVKVVHVIGDAKKPRTILDAIADGFASGIEV